MGTELKEDMLISILRLTEGEKPTPSDRLAEFMGLPMQRLKGLSNVLSDEGLVEVSGSDVSLTDKGLHQAREIRKKHHVMESFLTDVLGMDHMSAHKEAHKMEHSMSQDSMQRLCGIVGNKVDKDCSACMNPCNTAIQIDSSVLLTEMQTHRKGKIAFLRSGNPDDVKKLISMGFVPGRDISVESKISENGPRVVNLGESTVALDSDFAKAIYVNVTG